MIYAGFINGVILGSIQEIERGSEEWREKMRFFNNHGLSDKDMVEITQEEYQLYRKGYTRGEDGTPIAPVPVVKTEEEQLEEIQTQFNSDLQKLRKEYVNAQMASIDTTPIQKSYDELVASSNEKAIQVIENVK